MDSIIYWEFIGWLGNYWLLAFLTKQEPVNWSYLIKLRDKFTLRALVNTVMNLRVP
jgi:hypothetical protein